MNKKELTDEEKQKLLTNRFTAPFKGETIGHRELTEEEKKEAEVFCKKIDERKENK
ncbi:hypothetical protein K8P03_07000 [Anaerococcus murdochii]|uniref:Uncharacterized protein n=1 Tax=Anaerococcus murdochii TaxID=411577 RepID=A0ABS7SZT5_9FIRM|nr:hypothetical protein [Anaerococcus murdochii]MBZ2387028.1 hypothetical protein [Anaerococcus murdochii]